MSAAPFPRNGYKARKGKSHVSNAALKGGITGNGCTSLLTKDGA